MKYTNSERAVIWLCCMTKSTQHQRITMLSEAKSPEEILKAPEKFFDGLKKVSYEKDAAKREEALDAFLKEREEKGQFIVTLFSKDYPERLKKISLPPLILFGQGDRSLLKERMFCIVGSRSTPSWTREIAIRYAKELTEKFTIVTGLAEGGDNAAIDGALPSGKLISVLPCGLDECFPAAHRGLKDTIAQKGLLLSPFMPEETARKFLFPERNRILAGLAEGVLVVSARHKSGALLTAGCAMEFGKPVFAFPYNIGIERGEGCNDLIKKGARLVSESEDIWSVYGMHAPADPRLEGLTPEEEEVFTLLREQGQLHPAAVALSLNKKIAEVVPILSALEIRGLLSKDGGNKYSVI